ncbi:hypothetical protein BRD20_03875 [Halobacteriales archaeon SW_8_65_20]|nr:MAG: hypothetical protein BRD20_03875 [Halobacteriales archaeon SW_8_65_20]
MNDQTTRRRFVQLTGATVAATAGLGTAAAGDETATNWTTVETPTGRTLYDVAATDAGVYAVGAGGVVLERGEAGYETVLDSGPTGNGNSLYGSATTDDGERLWFVGSSGAIGEYDPARGTFTDYSAPNDVTNNFNDVAVTGAAGDANVYVAGDSGKIYYSFDDGETFEDVTPASGSNVNAVDFHDDRAGHIVDGNETVLYTEDGATWNTLGIADANVNFYGVDSDGFDDVTVSGGGGVVWNWDGSEWRAEDTGDAGLRDIEVTDSSGLTVGGGGKMYRRGPEGWIQEPTPTGSNLKAVLRGDIEVAVGAGGTVIENQ